VIAPDSARSIAEASAPAGARAGIGGGCHQRPGEQVGAKRPEAPTVMLPPMTAQARCRMVVATLERDIRQPGRQVGDRSARLGCSACAEDGHEWSPAPANAAVWFLVTRSVGM
jgi:hypothetical protein